jgi:4-hydroxy-4-methyl-2-oxoglutarate aldolase
MVEVTGDADAVSGHALMGDIIAHAAKRKGLAGLVTNGVVRDWAKMKGMAFPVFATGLNILGPAKADPGEPHASLPSLIERPA